MKIARDIQGIVRLDGSLQFIGVVALSTLRLPFGYDGAILITTPESTAKAVVDVVQG
jgi:hypothetical protein